MRKVGAQAVACASALGRYGVSVFERITKGEAWWTEEEPWRT